MSRVVKNGGLTAFKSGLMQKLFSQQLRFASDDGTDFQDWKKIRLGDYLVPHRERVPADTEIPIFSSSREGLKPQKEYFSDREVENFGEYGIVPNGHITYRHMSDDLTFKFNLNTFGHPIAVSKEYPVFATSDMDPRFLVHWLNNSREFGEFAVMQKKGGTRTRLHFNVLSELRFDAPHSDEQRKIADALGAVDEKIAALSQKLGVLEKFRGGVMHNLFFGKKKFRAADGIAFPDWATIRLGDAFRNRVEPDTSGLPVYSVTQDRGMVPRDTLDRDFGGSAEITGYRRACAGDLVYNTMRMWQGAVGIAPEDCCVSPAYVVLAPKEGAVSEFFVRRLRESTMVQHLKAWSHGLTEDRLRLYYPDFASIRLRVPGPDEQRKIADALSALDAKIVAVAGQITHMEAFKKGLLQQMFV